LLEPAAAQGPARPGSRRVGPRGTFDYPRGHGRQRA